jgi:hypothetical protein
MRQAAFFHYGTLNGFLMSSRTVVSGFASYSALLMKRPVLALR